MFESTLKNTSFIENSNEIAGILNFRYRTKAINQGAVIYFYLAFDNLAFNFLTRLEKASET